MTERKSLQQQQQKQLQTINESNTLNENTIKKLEPLLNITKAVEEQDSLSKNILVDHQDIAIGLPATSSTKSLKK
jgi:hypothetical protein